MVVGFVVTLFLAIPVSLFLMIPFYSKIGEKIQKHILKGEKEIE